jgi:hypothetical protein
MLTSCPGAFVAIMYTENQPLTQSLKMNCVNVRLNAKDYS